MGQQIQQELKLLEQACDQLKASQSFLKILEMVLAVGNHLNGGSFRGAASGFKLGALLKLMDVKSHNKKTTLLHFVVAELLRTDEKVYDSSFHLSTICSSVVSSKLEPVIFVFRLQACRLRLWSFCTDFLNFLARWESLLKSLNQ